MSENQGKNVMDRENYTKKRLIDSLKTIEVAVEDGEERDTIALHIAHVIQEIENQPPYIKIWEDKKYCSFCLAKEGSESLTEEAILDPKKEDD